MKQMEGGNEVRGNGEGVSEVETGRGREEEGERGGGSIWTSMAKPPRHIS